MNDCHHKSHRCGRHADGSEHPHAPPPPPIGRPFALLGWMLRGGWLLFCKNRFMVAVASLIWLVWRSGSQPRRLAYPCQQAAAANLGFLAVLFVPALARKRRARLASARPHAAELATGSVALAGVLFILVSAGVEVYSDLTAAWTPGNPAVVAWSPSQPTGQAEMSPRVLVPSNNEAVVAVNRDADVVYGSAPYARASHSAYELVWRSVTDLRLGPADNPLRDLVADMDGDGAVEVFIKPNTVEYYGNDGSERSAVYVHPAMLRPLVDMAVLAGATKIGVGDGSDGTGAFFTSKLDPMGYTESYFNQMRVAWPGVAIDRVDLNSPKRWTWVNLGTQPGGASTYVGSGYTSSQLQKARDGASVSYFAATDSHGKAGPGTANCMGWLAIADAVLDADVVIDLAKLKVHYLGVNTAALKNWVGITMFSTYNLSNIYGCRMAHNVYGASSYEMQFGNDILWRELVDAHRAVLYHRNAAIQSTPQRRYLCVVDAINGGERYHVPNKPWPVWLDTVLAGVDPVAVDAVGSRLQRYDFRRIPIVNNAHAVSVNSPWPIGTADPAMVRVVGEAAIDSQYDRLFAWETAQDPNMSWPDWSQTAVNDLQPPAIGAVSRQDLGGQWRLETQVTGCRVAFFSYGDAGDGHPRVVRLARDGDAFGATLPGAVADGVLTVQDEYFNTVHRLVSDRPMIAIDGGAFARSALCGQALSDDTFAVRNSGPGVLQYTVAVDAASQGWLSVVPASGSSSGESDTIRVRYRTSGLGPGTWRGVITVSDPESYNRSATVQVTLTISGYVADFDGDRDVDQEDYAHLQVCLSGELVSQSDPACADARLDPDADVDGDDIGWFMRCFSGPGVPADACCVRAD